MKPERSNNEQKPLSPEKISQYLMGSLTSKEQQALEKSALSNPFEQEALEGFEAHPEVSWAKTQKDLERRMKQRLYKEKSQFMLLTARRWAAVVILMLCASSIYWFLHQNQNASEITTTEAITASPHKENEANTNAPTESLIEDTLDGENIAFQETKSEENISNKASSNQKTNTPKIEEPSKRKSLLDKKTSSATENVSEKRDINLNAPNGELAVNEQNVESLSSPEKEQKEKTSQAQDETKPETDVVEESITYDDASREDFKESSISERKAERAKSAISEQKKKDDVSVLSWKNFVKNNLKYPAKALENKIQGVVKVQFEVDKKGKVSNIKIIQSLSEECNAEAIRLIKAYNWTEKGKKEEIVEFIVE
ncbi:MAG: hypothetical protein OHK0038_25010 [Flammeovirgaceae bacterium]